MTTILSPIIGECKGSSYFSRSYSRPSSGYKPSPSRSRTSTASKLLIGGAVGYMLHSAISNNHSTPHYNISCYSVDLISCNVYGTNQTITPYTFAGQQGYRFVYSIKRVNANTLNIEVSH